MSDGSPHLPAQAVTAVRQIGLNDRQLRTVLAILDYVADSAFLDGQKDALFKSKGAALPDGPKG